MEKRQDPTQSLGTQPGRHTDKARECTQQEDRRSAPGVEGLHHFLSPVTDFITNSSNSVSHTRCSISICGLDKYLLLLTHH